jgi:hypothetical protein
MALVGPRSKVRPALPQWVPRCRESSFSSDDGRRSSKGHGGEGVATTIPRSFERRRLTRRFTHSRALSLRDFARIYLLGKQNDVPSKRSIGRGSYLCEFLPSSFESPISFLLSGGSTGAPCILLMSLFFLACLLPSSPGRLLCHLFGGFYHRLVHWQLLSSETSARASAATAFSQISRDLPQWRPWQLRGPSAH